MFKKADTPEISVQQLFKESQNTKDFYLLDVRTQEEFDAGHLEMSDNLIPYDQVSQFPTCH